MITNGKDFFQLSFDEFLGYTGYLDELNLLKKKVPHTVVAAYILTCGVVARMEQGYCGSHTCKQIEEDVDTVLRYIFSNGVFEKYCKQVDKMKHIASLCFSHRNILYEEYNIETLEEIEDLMMKMNDELNKIENKVCEHFHPISEDLVHSVLFTLAMSEYGKELNKKIKFDF